MTEGFLRSIILAVAAYGIGAGEACAQAQGLAAVRPADPASKLPQFYQDRTGLAFGPCLDKVAAGDFCGILAKSGTPNPAALMVFSTNFSNEFLYWSTTTTFDLPITAGIFPPAATLAPTPVLAVKPATVVSPLDKGRGGGRRATTSEVTLITAPEGAHSDLQARSQTASGK